jgi:hypothetical protein
MKGLHDLYLQRGLGRVSLPNALERKYPNASKEWGWQWVFPAGTHFIDRVTGEKRRHHLHESVLQKAVKEAVRNSAVNNQPARTRSAIRLQRICWKTATTFAPFRSCSAIEM